GEHGTLDVLVCSAGLTGSGACIDLDDEEWDRVIDVNLCAPFRYCRATVPLMPAGGSMLFVASTAPLQGLGPVHYVASKSGVHGLIRALARELAPRGITVNAVSPGFVDTEFHGNDAARELLRAQAAQLIPARRLA